MRALALAVLLLAAAPATARDSLDPGDHELSVRAGGLERRFRVHVPAGYDATRLAPVVLVFHGGGGTGGGTMRDTGWAEKADRAGFFAVFPDGVAQDLAAPPRFLTNPQVWNDGSGRAYAGRRNVDDVGFVSAILDTLAGRAAVDPHRVFATGFSNGASMTFRVGVELARRIAAIAPVAGHLYVKNPAPARPVPMLYIVGTADPLIPLEGGTTRGPWGNVDQRPPVIDSILVWAKALKCTAPATVPRQRGGVNALAWTLCPDGSEVVFYTVEGLGHVWPGGRNALPESMVGKGSDKLNATDVIWEFFAKHPLK